MPLHGIWETTRKIVKNPDLVRLNMELQLSELFKLNDVIQ